MDLQDAIDVSVPPSGPGCIDCDSAGGWWVQLRRCALCGHVGCCDSSPGRHATAHWKDTGHRLVRSYEPGEDWYWDFESEQAFDGPALADPQARPAEQGSPAPADRVPANWRELIR